MEDWKQEESLNIYESPNPYGVLIGLPVGIIAMTERTPKVSKDGTEYILVDN